MYGVVTFVVHSKWPDSVHDLNHKKFVNSAMFNKAGDSVILVLRNPLATAADK